MNLNNTTDNNQTKRQPFLAMIDGDILSEAREVARENRFSLAHFLRESIIQNLASYRSKRVCDKMTSSNWNTKK
jgi:hypothetical protein